MSASEPALTIDPPASVWLPETRLKSWAGIGTLLALALTGFMSFVTWQSTRQGEQGEDWVVHTFTVEQRLQAAVAHSAGAENRARVFAVTGNQTVLDSYKTRQLALAQDLQAVRQLTADNSSQQKRLDRLEPQVNASMQSQLKIQDERGRTGAPPSASELLDDKLRMDAVRATLVEMQGEEARLLNLRMGKTQEARHLTRITVLSSALTGVALLLLAGLVLLREINRSSQMQGQVRTLEQRSEESRREDKQLREANQALAESEERFRLLVEPVKDYGIYMLDPEGRIVTWNAGAERIKGYKTEEVLGRNYSMFFPPEAVEAGMPFKELAEAARDGRLETETWRVRKNGAKFWALVTLTAIRGQNGALHGFAKVCRDLTEQKEAEQALLSLNSQLEHYRIVVEHIGGYAIYTLDAEGIITSWGAGAQRTSGLTPEEVMGRHYSLFFPAADVLAGVPQQDLAEAARTGCYAKDGWMVKPNGERRWASGMLNAVRNESGELTGFIRVGRDMTAQKEAAESLVTLNSQLERYRLLVEHIDEYAIYTLDAEGIITSWGAGAQKVSGATAEEVMGRHYSFFFPAAAVLAGLPQRELDEAARTGRFAADAWMVTPDGDRKWSSGVLNAVRDECGELTGFIRVARDMTPYKRADEDLRQANRALEESEERFRLLVEPVTDYGIIMLDPEGRVVTWNVGAERIKGYKAEEVLERNFAIFFPPEDAKAGLPAQELVTAARDGRFEAETWRMRKDGTKFWALVTLTAVYRQDGTLRGFAKVFRDMTKQKEAAESLRQANRALVESEERFRLLVEPVKEYAIYMLDPEGRILTWNEGAERSKGYKAAEVVGRNFAMFYLPADVQAGLPATELAAAAREGRFETAAWRLRKDGEIFWGLVTLTALHLPDGALRGFATVTRDMTKQKEMEDSLQRLAADLENRVEQRTRDLESAMKELHRKNEEVEAFVYIVSHDLRAPLVNVQGFVRELEDSSTRLTALLKSCSLPPRDLGTVNEILDEEIAGALHFISASATKFERLIDALIGLSRYGRQTYQIERIDVQELLEGALATFMKAINEAGAEVKVGRLPVANADVTALGQVFSNLIGNALKYRSPLRPLQIQIGGRVEDGTIHYWVEDNGLGIPESGKARLFQVFQRLHPQAATGEGMGLAIVHRIVERHQGKVWAESREGAGTAFHFSLPSNPGSTTNIDLEINAHETN
jgi:PAS domain S-box-containing protein